MKAVIDEKKKLFPSHQHPWQGLGVGFLPEAQAFTPRTGHDLDNQGPHLPL